MAVQDDMSEVGVFTDIVEAYETLGVNPEQGFSVAQAAFYALIQQTGREFEQRADLVEAYELLKGHEYPFMPHGAEKPREYAETLAISLTHENGLSLYRKIDQNLEASLVHRGGDNRRLALTFAGAAIALAGMFFRSYPAVLAGGGTIAGIHVSKIRSENKVKQLEKQYRKLENTLYLTSGHPPPATEAEPTQAL